MKKIDFECAGVSLSRRWLVSIKTRALRNGVWYSVLSRSERGFLGLAIRVVERVRSRLLGKVLSTIVGKLAEALESPVWRLTREVGPGLALQLSHLAVRWGNSRAVSWVTDAGFVRYLAIMHLNAVGPP